ncbi:tRNA (adenosine(37)-N6)-dimethylallyltransferase MiaA [Canibacter sp. lx-45]|uniref:tRNA (adenosine(37)-N6)-dimethylallyltransferase MiaA n=1 Tax=Canibacter zhuwentaonis TaxID=2837491 RepID=UPI001BDD7C0A|nr:tRNA (adenosine(37)-N6)-dimethylallyltransferase MiaA [Canibacter zhuwentaonis]MBT1035093.1 tRNA (adenosine(37)-N6)-dimethylallyltransferase MiaA [Canibacter zhuwentaonis]
MEHKVPPVITVIGATGVGKSGFAINLAQKLRAANIRAEIINADSMQLYRGMDIGTAKLPLAQRAGVMHHMLDVLEPNAEATVSAYQKQTGKLIDSLRTAGIAPILVGGSGLYINSVLYRMDFAPHNEEIRAQLESRYASSGIDPLIIELIKRDPTAEKMLDLQNPRRVIRALEVLQITGKTIAAQLPQKPELLRPTRLYGIYEDRAVLVERLAERTSAMWQQGLIDEVAGLLDLGILKSRTASQAIGYAQAIAQLAGELTQSEAIAQTQLLTRKYARRQVSWFKRLHDVTWITSAQSCDERQLHEIGADIAASVNTEI